MGVFSAICAQSSTIVHFCGPFGPLSKGNFRRKMTTIVVGNRGQLWTSNFSPHLLSPHLDFPEMVWSFVAQAQKFPPNSRQSSRLELGSPRPSPKGPFRTKNTTPLNSVVFYYCL